MDDSEIVSEVENAYRHYIDTFNRRDAAEFAQCYDQPHAGLSGDRGLLLTNTDADHDRWYQQVVADADSHGWARTDIDRLQVWPLSRSMAQLIADVTRFRKDGSVWQRVRATYMLRRREGRWKMMTYGVIEEPFPGPGLPATRHDV